MTKSIGAAIRSLDPDLPMADTETMDQVLTDSHAGDRFSTALIANFAAVALLLAVLGVYGVMAFLVAQRTHEIGLRIALGAGRFDILRMVLGEGVRLSAIGLALGLAGAYLVGRAMQSMLYGVKALDLTAFVSVAALLLASAIAACCIPARRATSVDPAIALRED
jgi:putative ABC transport system permease protein